MCELIYMASGNPSRGGHDGGRKLEDDMYIQVQTAFQPPGLVHGAQAGAGGSRGTTVAYVARACATAGRAGDVHAADLQL